MVLPCRSSYGFSVCAVLVHHVVACMARVPRRRPQASWPSVLRPRRAPHNTQRAGIISVLNRIPHAPNQSLHNYSCCLVTQTNPNFNNMKVYFPALASISEILEMPQVLFNRQLQFVLPEYTSPPLPEAIEATPEEYRSNETIDAARTLDAAGLCV